MHSAWNDDVCQLPVGRRRIWQRWWHVVLCLCRRHVMGAPQIRRPSDLTLSHGPCRWCGGEHYWRHGQWVARYKEKG